MSIVERVKSVLDEVDRSEPVQSNDQRDFARVLDKFIAENPDIRSEEVTVVPIQDIGKPNLQSVLDT